VGSGFAPLAPHPGKHEFRQTAAHRHTENPTQEAPGPAVTLPPPNAGLPEAKVQSFVVSYLVSQGWQIQRVADTASREQGIDILAARDGRTLAVEMKGFPGTAYADPRRSGETKTTTPAAQARARPFQDREGELNCSVS
jgi:hypothetical protein